jgi:magnesium-transporting ATPase (P-type)
MIETAVILSAVARHWPDFAIIFLLLLANAVVGFWEEHQAGNAIAALKAKLAINARVRRDGNWTTTEARELVPGDVIRLRLGDIVPTDARLLEGDPIEVDQSELTGESLPATRKPGEAVFSGSIIRQGEICALVYATGANTYFGKTAQADAQGPWQFIGVLPLFDPPREEAKATITTASQMGVMVKMVTGDQLSIAKETAKKLGMGTAILDASGFGDTKHHETAQLAESIEKADGFAQVFPEHKFHIIDVMQQLGHIVGMTGDGVNDAPALKKADCGIAVSGATDAARAAASIVLLSPGLSVIIDAIKESRKIFQRMNSYAI